MLLYYDIEKEGISLYIAYSAKWGALILLGWSGLPNMLSVPPPMIYDREVRYMHKTETAVPMTMMCHCICDILLCHKHIRNTKLYKKLDVYDSYRHQRKPPGIKPLGNTIAF